MKTSTLLIGIVIILLVAGGAIYWIARVPQSQTSSPKTADPNTSSDTQDGNMNTANALERYQGDGFSLQRPRGWTEGHLSGTLVSFHNTNETHPTSSAAEKINFQSYVAVSFDNMEGKTLEDINALAIENLTASIPSTNIFATSTENINGQKAILSAMELTQQDVDFTILMVLIDAGNKYYSLSINTTTERWTTTKDDLYATVRSFTVETSS